MTLLDAVQSHVLLSRQYRLEAQHTPPEAGPLQKVQEQPMAWRGSAALQLSTSTSWLSLSDPSPLLPTAVAPVGRKINSHPENKPQQTQCEHSTAQPLCMLAQRLTVNKAQNQSQWEKFTFFADTVLKRRKQTALCKHDRHAWPSPQTFTHGTPSLSWASGQGCCWIALPQGQGVTDGHVIAKGETEKRTEESPSVWDPRAVRSCL